MKPVLGTSHHGYDSDTTILSIGIDDVDFRGGGCTTHFTGLLLHSLMKTGYRLADYPLLVRLNPGIPWKTRGNAATVIRVFLDKGDDGQDAIEEAWRLAQEYSSPRPAEAGKGPGIVAIWGYPWIWRLSRIYASALSDVLLADDARRAVEKSGGIHRGGRGVVGAAASIAALPPGGDYTWELIAYRSPDMWGSSRCVEYDTALSVEASIPPCTFNNIDHASRMVVAAPRGPDPVLAGFRGDCREYLGMYARTLCEKPDFWVLYRTNQHTDAPALNPSKGVYPYSYVKIEGTVSSIPLTAPGGHTTVRVKTSFQSLEVDVTFYRESYPLNTVARMLSPGDVIEVHGSVRPYRPRGIPTVAGDKLVVRKLSSSQLEEAPYCPVCGSRMESAGRNKGYRCARCGHREPRASKARHHLPRDMAPGVYTPLEGRLRHVVMPPWRRPLSWTPIPGGMDIVEVLSVGPRPPPHSLPLDSNMPTVKTPDTLIRG